MNDQFRDPSDEAVGRRLAAELPRYATPAHLRATIVEAAGGGRGRARRPGWLAPALTAAATTAVLVLFFLPLLPRLTPSDPAQRLVRAVVAEHTRALMWGARRGEIVPIPQWLEHESGIALPRMFAGDNQLAFEGAEPVYLERNRGVALHYRDPDGHLLTYVALPAPGLPLPERQRVQVGRFRPALVRDSGFSVWVWRHGDLGCFLVADMVSQDDLQKFKDYFVRLRETTEPLPAY